MHQSKGYYMGTLIDGKAFEDDIGRRGKGQWTFDHRGFAFYPEGYKPMFIPWKDVKGTDIGFRHAGTFAWGHSILKIFWVHEKHTLESGFIVAKKAHQARHVRQEIDKFLCATML
jgi:hypothetical protein